MEKLPIVLKTVSKATYVVALVAFLAGVVWLGGLRFFLLDKQAVHYHANFALYINGIRDTFKNPSFYEEVLACYSDQDNTNPGSRAHLHNSVNDVVHVHDNGVTWGHFFANLGYTLGDDVLKTDQGIFITGVGGNRLSFLLNSKPVEAIANRVIQSEDVLLIDYGQTDQTTLRLRYDNIARSSRDYNKRNDPGSCTGNKPEGLWERLKRTQSRG